MKQKNFIFYCICMALYFKGHTLNSQSPRFNILFFIDRFPCTSKPMITNQMKTLSKKFDISIHAKTTSSSDQVIPDFLKKCPITYGQLSQCNLEKVDVVLCQYGFLGKEYVNYMETKTNSCQKIITFFRGSDITDKDEVKNGSYNKLFEKGSLFIPVCSYYEYLLKILGCDPQKISVIPSSIDATLFEYREKLITSKEPIQIISVNRLIEKKGVDICIRAIAKLIKEDRLPIHYTIVGDGKEKKHLLDLAKRLGIQHHITIMGYCDHSHIPQLLHDSHIFISGSVTTQNGSQEGIPNTLKEAMAIGLPTISTYHAGIRELIEPDASGILVPERHVNALARNIKNVIQNKKKWTQITRNARKTIERNYDITSVNALLEKKINTLLSQ